MASPSMPVPPSFAVAPAGPLEELQLRDAAATSDKKSLMRRPRFGEWSCDEKAAVVQSRHLHLEGARRIRNRCLRATDNVGRPWVPLLLRAMTVTLRALR